MNDELRSKWKGSCWELHCLKISIHIPFIYFHDNVEFLFFKAILLALIIDTWRNTEFLKQEIDPVGSCQCL
jgi:hypothetical protein